MTMIAVIHSRHEAPWALTPVLAGNGYEMVTAAVRRSVIDELSEADPDVVVVDASTPDFDVLRLCRDVRRSMSARVVVIAPANVDEPWVMEAIRVGADDVITASMSDEMAETRVMALARLAPPHDRSPHRLVVGDVIVDLDSHSVLVGGSVVGFQVRLFRMLVALARRPNSVVTCEELLQDVWGVDPASADRRRIRVAASSLRRLLGHGALRPQIETVVRVGYRLVTVPATPAV